MKPNPAVTEITKVATPLLAVKICTCGKCHTFVPVGAKKCSSGHLWWDCDCRSTLVSLKEHGFDQTH